MSSESTEKPQGCHPYTEPLAAEFTGEITGMGVEGSKVPHIFQDKAPLRPLVPRVRKGGTP